jgi:hypothetical protein
MCEQREKLLSYVYDEGDATERAEVQRHLDQCPDCRAEIAGLRSVRSDLLAWEVPAHDPVWRPFETTPAVPWWRQVPAWAMAAAAAVVLLLGATGSVIAQAMMPERTVAGDTQTANAAVPAASPDFSAAQTRLAALERQFTDMGGRIDRVSNRSVSVRQVEGDHDAMVTQLQNDYRAQLEIIKSLQRDLVQLSRTADANQKDLDSRIKNLTQLVNSQILVR